MCCTSRPNANMRSIAAGFPPHIFRTPALLLSTSMASSQSSWMSICLEKPFEKPLLCAASECVVVVSCAAVLLLLLVLLLVVVVVVVVAAVVLWWWLTLLLLASTHSISVSLSWRLDEDEDDDDDDEVLDGGGGGWMTGVAPLVAVLVGLPGRRSWTLLR